MRHINKKILLLVLSVTILTGCVDKNKPKSVEAMNSKIDKVIENLDPKESPKKTSDETKEAKKTKKTKENKVTKKINETRTKETELYTGKIEHVFVHPLIVYPELAFDGDFESKNTFSKWFVTTKEFKRVLSSLYDNNFILVAYRDIYEEKVVNGIKTTVRKELRLPKGKKPIIISVDDLNANKFMLGNGITDKLVFDKNGEITGYIKNPKGEYITSKDSEIVPVLEEFLKVKPDFSHNNAKAVLAITGFEGILGYRTQKNSPNRSSEITEVKKIVSKLKKDGWEFASHSYGHPNLSKISLDKLKVDTSKWIDEVASIVGNTNIYITPFGSFPTENSGGLKYLQSKGYTIFAGVGPISYEKIYKNQNLVMTDRRNIDGITLKNRRDKFLDLYDANNIIDNKEREIRIRK